MTGIRPFEVLAVIGAGTMGTEISLRSAEHGYTVYLYDLQESALQNAARQHRQITAGRQSLGRITAAEARGILERIHYTTSLQEACAQAALVIEAVPERLALKRRVFADLDRFCPPETILATNSSSLRVALIEDATNRPEKVLNLHFFLPVREAPMVEIMGGTRTTPDTLETARRYAMAAGLTPLMVRKQSTGFLFNRIWRAVKKEALRVVDQGIASFEDVDRAWMIMYDTPRGPFGQMDAIGLDVVRDIELVYYAESGDPSDLPPRILLDKIERGELGVKTGKGFYTYPNPAYENPDWLKGA
ncbi:MAG: 3-hydroxyacyl-CoA dehydrogenase family protein [Chloroflexi bacterium]|nr:3-hydroxyacyl-CoA dehydrogenase family protein [Chloroflexota bacterium]